MDSFSYLFILVSIVVGLALTHLLHGFGQRIQHPDRFDLYWIHILWVAYVFEFIIAFWWFQYGYIGIGEWSFRLYLFVVAYAIVLYLMSVVLFPDDLGAHAGFREYFHARQKWFFGLVALTQLIDTLDTIAKGWAHAAEMPFMYWPMNGGTLVLAIVAARTRSVRFHAAFAILAFLVQSWFILRYYALR